MDRGERPEAVARRVAGGGRAESDGVRRLREPNEERDLCKLRAAASEPEAVE